MTKQEKLKVYNYVRTSLLEDIKGTGLNLFGFCNRIELALKRISPQLKDYYVNPYEIYYFKRFFPELYKYKPTNLSPDAAFWFKIDDYESRLEIINKVIEEMESK